MESPKMDTDDTIAAIATASGAGAIAIVRLTGSAVYSILSRIFHSHSQQNNFEGHRIYHGFLIDPSDKDHEPIDEVVVATYRSPHSYTGEDLAEINCHGGHLISRHVLELLLKQGARLAHPGEFTQRAYLSGKLDLTQAEAVLDVIQAKTKRQGKLAVSALSGHLGKQIAEIRLALVDLLTRVTAGIDFPDEVGDAPVEELKPALEAALNKLHTLSQTALSGKFLREGLRLAIVGRPNAGKSSLLNQLLKFERAIVTDVPGTTRDSIEEQVDINGIPITLIDTAGIRSTQDNIERIGIERSRQAVKAADLVILIVDLLEGWGEPESHIKELIGERPHLLAYNKVDAATAQRPKSAPSPNGTAEVFISAKEGAGLQDLGAAVERWALGEQSLEASGSTLNERQAQLCMKAEDALISGLKAISSQLPQDCIATDLKIAIDSLSEISGYTVSEEIISEVFANFCIGK
jgi:tRNA modification GTPase